MKLRLIGDVHGQYHHYLPLLKNCDYSIQVGDLGLDYDYLKDKVDTSRHRAIGGNHENYEQGSDQYFKKQPIFLDDYGVYEIPGFSPIFYVRGAWSIDRKYREGRFPTTWWPEEELSYAELNDAITLYKEVKPDFVVTHEAPLELVQYVTNPDICSMFGYAESIIKTRTNQALQAMFAYHQPSMWVFGHYHQRWEDDIKGTNFVCLDMCRNVGQKSNYIDIKV